MTTGSPQFEPLIAPKEHDDKSGNGYRLLIGGLGAVLPIAVWFVSGLRPTAGLDRWHVLTSISSYYYTGSTVMLVGVLVSIGLYLISYEGYDNPDNAKDLRASRIAGAAALVVAAFPTASPNDALQLYWWRDWNGWIHYGAAAVLFYSFSYFCRVLFTKTDPAKVLSSGKQVRNGFYLFCGYFIYFCMGWIAVLSLLAGQGRQAQIFLPEALALEAFAFSWLIKGRLDRTAVVVVKRAAYYGRHPGQLVAAVRRVAGQ